MHIYILVCPYTVAVLRMLHYFSYSINVFIILLILGLFYNRTHILLNPLSLRLVKRRKKELKFKMFSSPLLSIWLNGATNSHCFGIKTYDIRCDFSQQQIRGINIILSIMMLRRASIETRFKVEVKLKVQKQPRSMLGQNGCNTTLIGKKSMNGQNLIDKTQWSRARQYAHK